MKGMRELREVLRTVETKATQNFKVVTHGRPQGWVLAVVGLFRGRFQWETTEVPAGSPCIRDGNVLHASFYSAHPCSWQTLLIRLSIFPTKPRKHPQHLSHHSPADSP